MEVRCPKCKGDKFSIVGAGTVKCSYCGHVYPLRPTQEEVPQPEPTQTEEQKPEAPQPQTPKPTVQPIEPSYDEEPEDKSRRYIIIAIVACIVIAIIALVAMNKGGSDDDLSSPATTESPYDDSSYNSAVDTLPVDSEPVPDYDEEQAAAEEQAAKEQAQAAEEAEVHSFIRDMYNNRRYDDDTFLHYHCSPKMISKLRDGYDYDCDTGDCLAGWMFRSGAQDGLNNEYGIIEIKTLEGNWYSYTATDYGTRFTHKIKVVKSGSDFIIDDLK